MNVGIEDKIKITFKWMNDIQFECGNGWQWIILNLCREIDDAYFNFGRETEIMMIQCKEKYGELRFYYGYLNEDDELNETAISDIIEKYRLLSTQTCELCGDDGHLLMNGYDMRTRCWRCK